MCQTSAVETAGTPHTLPELPHPKRLSFMGELTSLEPIRRASQATSSAAPAATTAKLESGNSLSVMPASTAVDDTNKEVVTDSNTAAEQPTILSSAESSLQEVPRLSLEGSRQLDHSLSEANLGSLSSRSLDASKRQLTSLHSMQSKPAQEASKKRAVRHSASGKIAVPGPNGSYSSRYANRQLSGKASPLPSESGLSSGKRSLVTSPTASVHGGQGIPAHLAGRLSGGRPATAAGADDQPGQTLAGAAAMLSGRCMLGLAHQKGLDGTWPLGMGCPFHPGGALWPAQGGPEHCAPSLLNRRPCLMLKGICCQGMMGLIRKQRVCSHIQLSLWTSQQRQQMLQSSRPRLRASLVQSRALSRTRNPLPSRI